MMDVQSFNFNWQLGNRIMPQLVDANQDLYEPTPVFGCLIARSGSLSGQSKRVFSDRRYANYIVEDSQPSPKRKKMKNPVFEETYVRQEEIDQLKTNLDDLKGSIVSLIDSFTAEQIIEHLQQTRAQAVNTVVEKESNGNKSAKPVSEKRCRICSLGKLPFTPPPLICTKCEILIDRRMVCNWILDEKRELYCFCNACLKKIHGDKFSCGELSFSKKQLRKGKYIEESEEKWIHCYKCDGWQHQICALFNDKQDFDGDVTYICTFCLLYELKENKYVPATTLGARDLPRTMLSDHIEERLSKNLKRERKERAKLLGKSLEEVPEAKDLVVREVLDVNKEIKVKQKYLDILNGQNYPTELPYKLKVILLFQKLEGVEVCIFGMYVQEFGSECGKPNQRAVYISYLDSVNYFTPNTRTVAGDALRTFVYHEILIGYLDYCKQRGFTTCYIWSCPPSKGNDYILNCHPITQVTPKSDKLRNWYKSMLKKAMEENVVTDYNNFYDKFLCSNKGCTDKITAARLPYIDGSLWSAFIESTLQNMVNDTEEDSKRKLVNEVPERYLKEMAHSDLSAKDILVMNKLKRKVQPTKEDLFVVNLAVNDVAANTKDKDATRENELMENRQSFLKFCQKNHYQFDTLRRAKHSSMMILYNLHKTTVVEPTSCYIPKSCQHLTEVDCKTGSKKTQQQREPERVREMLNLLAHANQCTSTKYKRCSYPKCDKVKWLFFHGLDCERRIARGCDDCKKLWGLMKLHSQNCEDCICNFPSCKEIKIKLKSLKSSCQ